MLTVSTDCPKLIEPHDFICDLQELDQVVLEVAIWWHIYCPIKCERSNTIIKEVISRSAGTITMNQSHVDTTELPFGGFESEPSTAFELWA